jgi:hypothetical protein
MLSGGSSKPILNVTFPEVGEGLSAVARDEIRPPITAKAAAAAAASRAARHTLVRRMVMVLMVLMVPLPSYRHPCRHPC